jgi:hypothetical protein
MFNHQQRAVIFAYLDSSLWYSTANRSWLKNERIFWCGLDDMLAMPYQKFI